MFRKMNNIISVMILTATLLAGSTTLCRADLAQHLSEYQVKAAYMYNFTKYVDWPSHLFSSEKAPINVCIIGKNPFGQAIEALTGKVVRNRGIAVRHISRIDDVKEKHCHILFVSGSEKAQMKQILDATGTTGILTVSDIASFARNDGMIGLVIIEGKVRFEINLKSAQHSGLRISSNLLRLATVVVE
ncbi:MAG: YfiR family protein [Geobacteraceae bacterium]